MSRLYYLVILLIVVACGKGKTQHPVFVETDGSEVVITGYKWPQPFRYSLAESDTVSPGTDGYRGAELYLITQEDTVTYRYSNTPYKEHFTVTVASPTDTTVVILRFNAQMAEFSHEYIVENTGKAQFEIPEVYELANVLWSLSPSGARSSNLYTEGDYYEKVVEHFAAYQDHSVFESLDLPDEDYFSNHYGFRENSLCFEFDERDSLVFNGQYYHVWGKPFQSLFHQLTEEVQDFARKSDFRSFFEQHRSYYQDLIANQKKYLPVDDMWQWLEGEFPARVDAYKIVFSPLIGGSHSTRSFWYKGREDEWFQEAIMFVNGPQVYDGRDYSDTEMEGLHSGIVFTEIDHNYVNPVSSNYSEEIEKLFSDRDKWTAPTGDAPNYGTPKSVFNEYTTHAVFCLYTEDKYDQETADFVVDRQGTNDGRSPQIHSI